MRIRPILISAGLAVLSLSAQAQSLPGYQRPADDTTFSVLAYERIGATPSIDLKRFARGRRTVVAPQAQAEAALTRAPARASQARAAAAPEVSPR